MVLVDRKTAPFVVPIDLERASAEELLEIRPDQVALVEGITPGQVPLLVSLLEQARRLVAEVYLLPGPEMPGAFLVPVIYVLIEPRDSALYEEVAATRAVPISLEDWDDEVEALRPLLTEPLT